MEITTKQILKKNLYKKV